MIVILKKNHDEKKLDALQAWLNNLSISIQINRGVNQTVLGLLGDTTQVDISLIQALDIVEDVKRVQEPYKKASRKFHPENTTVKVGDVYIGDGKLTIMAGPCSVESEEQIMFVAQKVKESGAHILRGGAFKPRTSPYAFQGLRKEGIKLLIKAKKATGLPLVSEVMDVSQIDDLAEVDMLQVGTRNMQNFELLKALGKVNKPILLKRGMSSTISELLMSAEYIMAGGNENVVPCERGIRTFETAVRNTLDLISVPLVKELSHLPIIIDPSHATGLSRLVKPSSIAASAIGADGLIIEVHNDPQHALCDGPQSLTPEQFKDVVDAAQAVRPYASKI